MTAIDGSAWHVERRIRLGWLPKLRKPGGGPDALDFADAGVDDIGALVIIPLVILAVALLILLLPLLLFVLEGLLLLLLIVPLSAAALAVGLRRHEVVARNAETGELVHVPVRGLLASRRAKRRLIEQIRTTGRPTA